MRQPKCERPEGFTVTGDPKFTLQRTSLVEFWCSIKEQKYPRWSARPAKCSPFPAARAYQAGFSTMPSTETTDQRGQSTEADGECRLLSRTLGLGKRHSSVIEDFPPVHGFPGSVPGTTHTYIRTCQCTYINSATSDIKATCRNKNDTCLLIKILSGKIATFRKK